MSRVLPTTNTSSSTFPMRRMSFTNTHTKMKLSSFTLARIQFVFILLFLSKCALCFPNSSSSRERQTKETFPDADFGDTSGGRDKDNDQDNNVHIKISPLDPIEAEESAKLEEEEILQEISRAESELEEIVKAKEEVLEEHWNTKSKPLTEEERSALVKAKAVENLMQIFGLPSSFGMSPASPHREGSSVPAPEFMLDLYHTITDSSGVTRAKNPYGAHVVRSFLERDASQSGYFTFNVSCKGTGKEGESVLEAELHLHRLPTPHSDLHPSLYLTPFMILSLYQVRDPSRLDVPDLHKLLGVRYVPALGSGWEVFNVKKAVMEWLGDDAENYGFLVAATSLGGDRVPVRFSRRGHAKQPILVTFNEDENGKDIPEIMPKKRAKDSETSTETTTPLSSLENPQFHHSLLFQDSIRHPNSVSRFRSRRSRSNDTNSPSSSESTSRNETTFPVNYTKCGLHDFYVSFEAIGWSSWIISPKGYNAGRCDGPCVFPLGKNVSPTNHATVQSIVHELNLTPELSRPCCVPTALLPISLLYYDEEDNVVLKQYVDMVAEGCGCH